MAPANRVVRPRPHRRRNRRVMLAALIVSLSLGIGSVTTPASAQSSTGTSDPDSSWHKAAPTGKPPPAEDEPPAKPAADPRPVPAPPAPGPVTKETAPAPAKPARRKVAGPERRPAPKVITKPGATLLERAKAGDGAAQFELAQMHLEGRAEKSDPLTGIGWLILAASRDHPGAIEERDKRLAALSKDDRTRAFNRANNLDSFVAAGWMRDPTSGTAVWLPGWFRDGSFSLKVEVPAKDGFAHGEGSIALTASQPGDSSRNFKGRFVDGYFHGDSVREGEFVFLPHSDFRVRLAGQSPEFDGVDFWLRVEFGVQIAADPCYVATNRRPDIVVAVPEGFALIDDAAVEAAMREGWRRYAALCSNHVHADVHVTDLEFRYENKPRSRRMIHAPLHASGYFYGKKGESLSFGQFRNNARDAHERAEREAERERKRAERKEKRRQAAAAAKTRGSPDVRGVKLGMTVEEVRELFAGEIVGWEPKWRPDRPRKPHQQYSYEFKLADGGEFATTFVSSVSGSVLHALSYQQDFRPGVRVPDLKADLRAKYGAPDSESGGGTYWTYQLESRAPKEPLGAFLKISVRSFEAEGDVSYLRIIINDAGFGRHDERAAHAAKKAAQRQAHEAGKSEKPRF